MALKDSWNSMKNFFAGNQDNEFEYDEYAEDGYEEELQHPVVTAPVAGSAASGATVAKPKTGGYNTVAQRSSGMKVV